LTRRIAAVILAAGGSSRMGTPKQLIEWESQTLIRRTVQTVLASDADAVVVTTAVNGVDFRAELRGLEWMRAEVENPQEGQSQSVRAGTQAVGELGDFDAILFTPCDLPLLSVSHLNALIGVYRSGDWDITASRYCEVLGAPLIVSRALWPELFALRGDTGARKLLDFHAQTTTCIEWMDGQFDLDTPADVHALQKIFAG